jgi:signal transduction histidine kinase
VGIAATYCLGAGRERRRIERDLHDGAQQHLVAMAINLHLAQEMIRSEPAGAEELVGEVRTELGEALQTLWRRTVAGCDRSLLWKPIR